jgi:hypothetical protein
MSIFKERYDTEIHVKNELKPKMDTDTIIDIYRKLERNALPPGINEEYINDIRMDTSVFAKFIVRLNNSKFVMNVIQDTISDVTKRTELGLPLYQNCPKINKSGSVMGMIALMSASIMGILMFSLFSDKILIAMGMV